MKLTLITIYFVYIAAGIALRYGTVQNYFNKFKYFPKELYNFMSRLLIFLGAIGLITYVIVSYYY